MIETEKIAKVLREHMGAAQAEANKRQAELDEFDRLVKVEGEREWPEGVLRGTALQIRDAHTREKEVKKIAEELGIKLNN